MIYGKTFSLPTLVLFLLAVCGALGVIIMLVSKSSNSVRNSVNNRSVINGAATPSSLQDSANEETATSEPSEELPLNLPSASGSWMLLDSTYGGLSGRGGGSVIFTSQGDVAAAQPSFQIHFDCITQLSANDLRQIEQLIALSNPDAWRARYFDPTNPHGCCDQSSYRLELHRRKEDGSEQIYRVSWYDDSEHSLPTDLIAIHEAARRIKNQVLDRCGG